MCEHSTVMPTASLVWVLIPSMSYLLTWLDDVVCSRSCFTHVLSSFCEGETAIVKNGYSQWSWVIFILWWTEVQDSRSAVRHTWDVFPKLNGTKSHIMPEVRLVCMNAVGTPWLCRLHSMQKLQYCTEKMEPRLWHIEHLFVGHWTENEASYNDQNMTVKVIPWQREVLVSCLESHPTFQAMISV